MAPIEFDRREATVRRLENRLTPDEIAELLKDKNGAELPFMLRPLLKSGEPAASYIRESWAEDANFNFYTANRGARSLILAFSSAGEGFGVPVSYFLQMLREDLYDVVLLHDNRMLYFDRGVDGFAGSLLETVDRVAAFSRARGYREIITFGASMGGYPALRAGLLLGAKRAISLGGFYTWHIGRLLRNETTVSAFDLLCPCFSDRDVTIVAVVPAGHARDMNSLKIMRRSFPKSLVVEIDTPKHNLSNYLYRARLLRLFYACLFEYWDSDIRSELLELVNKVARGNWALEEERIGRTAMLRQRHREKLDALEQRNQVRLNDLRQRHRERLDALKQRHEERLKKAFALPFWRLTIPLRRLARAVRGLLESTGNR